METRSNDETNVINQPTDNKHKWLQYYRVNHKTCPIAKLFKLDNFKGKLSYEPVCQLVGQFCKRAESFISMLISGHLLFISSLMRSEHFFDFEKRPAF